MYVILVDFEIKAEHVGDFRAAVLTQARNSLEQEQDCLQFDVCTDPAAANRIFLYEVYSDEAAFKTHLATEHFAEFDALVSPWLIDKKVSAMNRLFPRG